MYVLVPRRTLHGNLHLAELPTCQYLGGATRSAKLAARANFDAQMPVRLFPRLARRAHAVSAALGRFHAPLTAQVPPIRPLRPVYPLRTRCRPMIPLSPCSHSRPRSPPHHRHPPLTDSASVALRPAHARQRLRRVAGCWCGRRCRYGARPALRDRAAACTAGLAVAYCPHSRNATGNRRVSTQPLSAVL